MNLFEYRAALELALQASIDYLASLETAPVAPTVTLRDLRGRLSRSLATDSLPADQVIQELVADTQGGILGSTGGRFFAWAIGGSLPAALAADWLTSAWDQNATLYASGPAAAVVEEVAGGWLKDVLRIPETASFALVSGCQLAHVTCLAAARHELLRERGWDAERRGLAGSPQIHVLACNAHGSIARAAGLLGIGSGNIEYLATIMPNRCARRFWKAHCKGMALRR